MSPLRSHGFRLALLYLVLFTASVVVIFVVIYWTTAGYMARALDLSVDTELSSLADIERSSGPAALVDAIAHRARTPVGRSTYALLQDPSGVKLAGNLAARSPHIGWQDLPMPKDSEGAEEGDMMRAKGLLLPDGYFLMVGQSAYQLRETDEVIVRAFGWELLVTVILGLIGGVLMSTGMLRRVESIRVTAQAIMAGNLSQRIPTRGTGDDFDLLSASLNEMLDRIHTLMEGLRQVSNDIAHDLRTPLTRLRQRLEIARTRSTTVDEYRQLVDTVIRDTDEILKTFAAMLRVAEIEAGTARARFAAVDLSALLKAIVELYAALAEDQQQKSRRPDRSRPRRPRRPGIADSDVRQSRGERAPAHAPRHPHRGDRRACRRPSRRGGRRQRAWYSAGGAGQGLPPLLSSRRQPGDGRQRARPQPRGSHCRAAPRARRADR